MAGSDVSARGEVDTRSTRTNGGLMRLLRREKGPKHVGDLDRLLPGCHVEIVGDRQEVVIYTGWTITHDGMLVTMDEFLD